MMNRKDLFLSIIQHLFIIFQKYGLSWYKWKYLIAIKKKKKDNQSNKKKFKWAKFVRMSNVRQSYVRKQKKLACQTYGKHMSYVGRLNYIAPDMRLTYACASYVRHTFDRHLKNVKFGCMLSTFCLCSFCFEDLDYMRPRLHCNIKVLKYVLILHETFTQLTKHLIETIEFS